MARPARRWAYADRPLPPAARILLDAPQQGLERLTKLMTAYWRRAIESVWPAIRAALEADIAYRAGRLAAGGPLAAFADLHDELVWREGALQVARDYEATVELGGRGLLLVPVAFAWPDLWAMIDPPWQPAVVYAPRGLATLWRRSRARPTRWRSCSAAAAPRSSPASPSPPRPTSSRAGSRRVPQGSPSISPCCGARDS